MNPKLGDKVEVQYRIWIFDSGEDVTIDETTDRPFIFEIGEASPLIQFFSRHILEMVPDSPKVIETICSQIYGEYGHTLLALPPSLNMSIRLTLVKTISEKLIEFPVNSKDIKYQAALKHKEEGNGHVSKQNYSDACASYLLGISLYVDYIANDQREREPSVELLLTQIFNNLALCELKMKRFNLVMDSCSTVLSFQSDDAAKSKAYFRYGEAINELRKEYLLTFSKIECNQGRLPDKDWNTKEARFQYQQSNLYSNGSDNAVKKKIIELEKIINAPKGFEGMFTREMNKNQGLRKI